MRRLGLKRKENAGLALEAEKKRAGPTQPAADAQATLQHSGSGTAAWAAAAPGAPPSEGEPSTQRQAVADSPPAAQQPLPEVAMEASEEDELEEELAEPLSPPAGDDETRQGLVKMVESMRRRVDAGHLQLLREQALLQQKQALVARGEAVLAQHCRASWQQQSPAARLLEQVAAQRGEDELQDAALTRQLRQMGTEEATVHSLEAGCSGGRWWLRASISLPSSLLQHVIAGRCSASLLAASPQCSLVCKQQHCALGSAVDGGGSELASAAAAAGQGRLELSALLDVQQAEAAQTAGAEPFTDVFLLLEQAGGVDSSAAALLEGPAAAPPVLLGRVQLSWQEWLKSHAADAAAQALPVPQPPPPQHTRMLVVLAEQLDLQCLHSIVQQQLGLVAAPPAGPAAATAVGADAEGADGSQQLYILPRSLPPGQPAASGPRPAMAAAAVAAAVSIRHHGSQFAEVQLHASSTQLLEVLQQQLSTGLRQAAAATGTPADDAQLRPCLLSPQHAERQAAVADCLVSQLDASIEWVEALLKEKLALSSQARRSKMAPEPAAVRRTQAAALAALTATDGALIRMLTESGS